MAKSMKIWSMALAFWGLCAMHTPMPGSSKYKCLVQMSKYEGEAAYITVSLINPKGAYEKTLNVMGEDDKWYNSLEKWYAFYSEVSTGLDAITGASVSGGGRSIISLELDNRQLNAGYKLRFESAVENQKYHADDVEVPLSDKGLSQTTEGKGYIRYVRFSKSK